jgi:SAM-dependent methyltransferase
MNIVAFRSMKDFWNKQSSGLLGPGGKKGGNYLLESRELAMFLDPVKKYNCLELGCGSGELHSEMSVFYSSYMGVDFSASNLEVFHKKHPGADITCSDVLAFETDQRFDLIHSNHMVQCLTAAQIALLQKKLLGMCAPGGIIIHRGFLDRRLKSLYFSGYLYPGIHRRIFKRLLHPLAYRALEFFNKITGTYNQLGYWHTREEILDIHQRLGAEAEIYNSPLHANRFNIVVKR